MSDLVIGNLLHVKMGGIVYLHPGVAVIVTSEGRPWVGVLYKRVMVFLATLDKDKEWMVSHENGQFEMIGLCHCQL